ncbi:MAG: GNAT family N-acetyltransferase [Geminicoccaceae bacterium]
MYSSNAAPSFSVTDAIDPDIPTTISGADQLVADWIAGQLGLSNGLGPSAGIGVMFHGELIAGVAFNNYHRHERGATIEASIAATTPRWATRTVLCDFFSYPFVQMRVTRLGVTCRKSNKRARMFVSRLGFKMEGCARRLWDGEHDAVVYSMMPEECRWLTG